MDSIHATVAPQPADFHPTIIHRIIFHPLALCRELADQQISAKSVFFRLAIWLGLLPPVFAFVGASLFGWRLGAVEPLFLPGGILLLISIAYYITLLFGFVSTALISRWMSATYGAAGSLGKHFAMVTVFGAPLVVGSVVHIFPHAFINILLLVPVLIWSMSLLYRGLPFILDITPQQGMLMASSLIAYLLVALVSLLGITIFLWVHGLGPALGI